MENTSNTSTQQDPSATPQLRLVQVGLGGFGTSWATTIVPSVPGVEVVAAVDVSPEALEGIRARIGLPENGCFSSLDAALQAVDADAVLITASLPAHIPVATAALEAGKHVLVEKPFAPTIEEAQKAVNLATERGLVLQVSQNYRYMPAPRVVADLMAKGTYGSVDCVYVDFRKYDNSAPQDGHRHYQFPQPMVVDMAIHHFDLMRLVLGREAREIECRSWNPPWSRFDEPAEMMAMVRFDGDVMVSYRGSWLSAGTPTAWGGEWRLELEGAEIAWTSREGEPPDAADAVTIRPVGGEPNSIPMPRLAFLDRAGSLSAFVEAIRTGVEPETSGRRNLQTLALTVAAIESSRTGKPVRL